jgi:branched-chain amino acid transport system substrate-binding protein
MYIKRWLLVVCLILIHLWGQPGFAENIKIGAINPLSGRFAKQGLEIYQGIKTAVAEANASGGIGGRLLELVSRDDQSQPDVAISRAEELCGWEKVLALTGGYVDSLVGPISEVARKYQVPYVASASLQKELVQRKNPYFFRVARLQGFVDPICDLLVGDLRPQRLGILHAATPGSTELARDLEMCLKTRGLSVRIVDKFRPGTPDFTPLISKLARLEVDVIVSAGFSPDHILFIRQLKENRVSLKAYIGPFGVAYESFLQAMGADGNYLYTSCAWDSVFTLPGTEEASKDFSQRFRRMFNRQPNTTNMHGYTSAQALIEAMRKTARSGRILKGETIRQALTETDLILPMEHLSFDQRGDPKNYRHVIVQIQGGKFVVVYPPQRATGTAVYPMPRWERRK